MGTLLGAMFGYIVLLMLRSQGVSGPSVSVDFLPFGLQSNFTAVFEIEFLLISCSVP